MKKAIFWIAIILAAVFVGRFALNNLFSGGETYTARERVRVMLEGQMPAGDLDHSIGMWSQGVTNFRGSMEEFDRAATEWEAWARRNEVLRVASFEILDAVIEQESELLGQSVVLVTVQINGKTYKMRVQQARPIEWAG